MHAVRRTLAEAQAKAVELPLWPVMLPWPCSNADYERLMAAAIARAQKEGVTHIAFGDLFLKDVRAYRERQLAGSGISALFPLWHPPGGTFALAREMLAEGLKASLTCVDPARLDPSFVGRPYNAALLEDLPPDVDPCGERGEFHTFCHAGPMFKYEIAIKEGEKVHRDGFWFADLHPTIHGLSAS